MRRHGRSHAERDERLGARRGECVRLGDDDRAAALRGWIDGGSPALDGVHFADYIRVVDVPESQLAFNLRGRQVRYLAITPGREAEIDRIELIKGEDAAAPVVMAITVEVRE